MKTKTAKTKKSRFLSLILLAACAGLLLWHFAGMAADRPEASAQQQAAIQEHNASPGLDAALAAGQDGGEAGGLPALTIFDGDDEAHPLPLEAAPAKADEASPDPASGASGSALTEIREDGEYTQKEDVALYIHRYGHLPGNFITKSQARTLGWGERYSSVDDAAPGKSIGGDRFGNRESLLPKKAGRSYTECDIGTMGKKSRGAKRIVFSNDGLVYYTGDHYESFELLYGSE